MVDTAYFLGLMLVFLRITTFFFVVKVFYPKGTPNALKIALGMVISFFIVQGIDTSGVLKISDNYSLIVCIVSEILSGLVLGFATQIIFEMAKMAGALIDAQIGLSMMNLMDPITGTNVTLLSNLTYYVTCVLFFIVNGHHVLIKCLVSSFDVVPITASISYENIFESVFKIFVNYFQIGVRIAIPIIFIVLLTDICMALISRTVPAINVMILGMPVRMVVGLVVFVLSIPIFIKIINVAFEDIPDFISNILKSFQAVPLMFIFASDDKTEEATPKKKKDAREKGQIAKSKDVGLALTMAAVTLAVIALSGVAIGNLKDYLEVTLQSGVLKEVTPKTVGAISLNALMKAFKSILPFALPIMIAGIIAGLMQTGFLLTGKPLKPSFGKLNPINGFKNIFSKKSLADLLKNLAVVTIIFYLGYNYVVSNYKSILQISNIYLPSLGDELKDIISKLFMQITIALVIIAAIDYFLQLRFHNKDLKMTKQEVKEEYKQMEGDPQIKSKIKQKQKEMATRRMMSSVADATVVVTNPTHIAVALTYEDGKNEAPKLVAKGADHVAMKIKEVAKENDVPIMENKPLARLIYKEVEIDQEIPQDMYQAVAEILAMVYKLKNKKS